MPFWLSEYTKMTLYASWGPKNALKCPKMQKKENHLYRHVIHYIGVCFLWGILGHLKATMPWPNCALSLPLTRGEWAMCDVRMFCYCWAICSGQI